MGETLAHAGFHVMRVDYHGTGESHGGDEDSSRIRAWIESVHQALDHMASLDGVTGVGVIGVRMGATLAAQVASERELAALVLWEPCPSGAHYAREMEILASAAPSAHRVAGGGVDAGGYVITRETLTDLARLDCWSLKIQGSPSMLLLGRNDRPPPTRLAERFMALGCATEVKQPQGFKEMMVYPEASIPAVEGFGCIEAWVIAHSTVIDSTDSLSTLELPTELDLGSIRKRTVRFGPEQRLFGVITEPTSGNESRPGVLFLAGGCVPRTSVNRMYVTLADELAGRGHRTLRFDVSGIGESAPAPGDPGRDPYPPTLMADVQAALLLLREDRADRPVWLVGLCSGAYAAFRSALDDPHVAGIVLLNPMHYEPMEGGDRPDTEQATTVEHYRQAAFDLQRWRRLLSDPQRIRRTLAAFAHSTRRRAARASQLKERRGSIARTVADDLIALREKGTEVHIVFAVGDPGQAALEHVLGESLTRLGPAGVHVREIEDSDHTFNSSRIRNELIRSILETICVSDYATASLK